jgi:hypothetical protein
VPIIVNDKVQLRRELEVISGQLARVGIKVEIQGLDWGTFNARFFGPDVAKKNFRAALRDIAIVSPDPDSTVYWFHRKGTTGWLGFESAPIDGGLDRPGPSRRPTSRTSSTGSCSTSSFRRRPTSTVHASYVSASRASVPTGAAPGDLVRCNVWIEPDLSGVPISPSLPGLAICGRYHCNAPVRDVADPSPSQTRTFRVLRRPGLRLGFAGAALTGFEGLAVPGDSGRGEMKETVLKI